MYRPALSRVVFRVVGLLVLPILALPTACGAPPPEEPKPLRPTRRRDRRLDVGALPRCSRVGEPPELPPTW